MLVRDATLGDALADSLGQCPLVLMRGHGSTVVGTSLRQAVYRAVYAETNARLQMEALRLGEPVYLSHCEAAAAEAGDGPANRPRVGFMATRPAAARLMSKRRAALLTQEA